MKKSLIVLTISTVSVLSAFSVSAVDGKVNFIGEITDQGCKVVNGPSNPLAVTLGKVAKSSFEGTGSRTAATKFELQLTDCPETVKSASVKFDGTPVDGDNTVLALTPGDGVAKGVGIQLSDDSKTVLPLFTASKQYALKAAATNNLGFIAHYIATANEITAGPANSTASFTIIYN